VVAQHSVGHWADRVLAVVREANGTARYADAPDGADRAFTRPTISPAPAAAASRKSQGTP
jgi:hypothetical protein